MNKKKAIEEYFPIVDINKLSIRERNSFKPIYQMHKWFARRSSCVFRAILLGALKPAGTDIMDEFYKNHTNDSDTNNIVILDPFMGGGTTIVEALRLGCNVVGIDLNPVAWFIVKSEVEPVDMDELKEAFKNLENRKTHTGQTLKQELLSHYKTECPCCENDTENADIIYMFWVKSAICTDPNCKKEVPLFKDYIISLKKPSIKYHPDIECPLCNKKFDLEIEPATLIGEQNLMLPLENNKANAGEKRGKRRWTYADNEEINCPHCEQTFTMKISKKVKPIKKKVDLTVVLCPDCFSIFQWRGELPDKLTCPVCKNINRRNEKAFHPKIGNIPANGKFICSCGNQDTIINSIRKLPENKLLPVRPYAIEGYCPECDNAKHIKIDRNMNLFDSSENKQKINASQEQKEELKIHRCILTKNNSKFFKKINTKDFERFKNIEKYWNQIKNDKKNILYKYYPKSKIPKGFNTNQMIKHNYIYWCQMFNPRQLYCLSLLLKCIDEEQNQVYKEMLLSAFQSHIFTNNSFCHYDRPTAKLAPIFARHDYQPRMSICENNIYGTKYGRGSLIKCIKKIIVGKKYAQNPFDRILKNNNNKIYSENIFVGETINKNFTLFSSDSRDVSKLVKNQVDAIITDPPYADNVNYSELADFFYVWLRIILKNNYPWYAPEETPKIAEIIEHKLRKKTLADFQNGLTDVFKNSVHLLNDNGILAFTYHHQANEAWSAVLEALFNSGFYLEAVYPYESDARHGKTMGAQKIAYDIIHVCKKRLALSKEEKNLPYSHVRREIRRHAREEIKLIESGRYGNEPLSLEDVNIILIGKCLELYSKNYGKILDYKDETVPLKTALSDIRMVVDQLVNRHQPLPAELENIDVVSYIYFICLCDRKEIQSDEVHKATRGIIEIGALLKAGIITRGRAKRGRTYEVKQPDKRFKTLKEYFGKKLVKTRQLSLFPEYEEEKFSDIHLVDIIHYLMGLVMNNENINIYLRDFESIIPNLKSALKYLKIKNPTFQEPINRILNLIEI